MSQVRSPGRRASRSRTPRLGAATALTATVPLLTLGASLLVQDHPRIEAARPPATSDLTSLKRACPVGIAVPSSVVIANSAGSAGTVTATPVAGGAETRLDLSGGRAESQTSDEATVVAGDGPMAIGLVAARVSERPVAALPCPEPTSEVWFPGVGARYNHDSVISVVNAEAGPAVVDVTVYTKTGILDVPRVQGVQVPGQTSLELDLGEIVPRTRDLGIRVVVSRGRASVTVRDTIRDAARRQEVTDWLVGQVAPAETNLLLGLHPVRTRQVLALTNPGPDEALASLKIVTDSATFAPSGLSEIRVPPHAFVTVSLSGVLAGSTGKDARGLVVSASTPLAAAVRGVQADGDLVLTSASPVFERTGAAVLPAASGELVLTAPTGSAQVTVTTRSAAGKVLGEQTLRVSSTKGVTVPLPKGAVVVEVRTDHPIAGAVTVSGRGAAMVPLLAVPTSRLTPQVAPARP